MTYTHAHTSIIFASARNVHLFFIRALFSVSLYSFAAYVLLPDEIDMIDSVSIANSSTWILVYGRRESTTEIHSDDWRALEFVDLLFLDAFPHHA